MHVRECVINAITQKPVHTHARTHARTQDVNKIRFTAELDPEDLACDLDDVAPPFWFGDKGRCSLSPPLPLPLPPPPLSLPPVPVPVPLPCSHSL